VECPRCGLPREGCDLLFCPECGKLWSRDDLSSVQLQGPAGMSPRVERFLATGDADYTDARIPIAVTDRANADLPRHIGGDA